MRSDFIKKILIGTLLGTLIPTVLFAAPNSVAKRNDSASTTLQNTNLGDVPLAGDEKGVLFTRPGRTGDSSVYVNLDLGASGVSIKGSAGTVTGRDVYNATGSTIYLKLYNKASAPSSADTPDGGVFAIPAGSSGNVPFVPGVGFSLGIGARCVTGVANNNNVSPAANGCILTLYYK